MTTKEKRQTVAETIKALKHKHGEDSIMKLNQQPLSGVDAIPTGSFGLDIALGVGGLPRGRMIEIFGPESSGKTTLALHVIANAQKAKGVCAYIDAEYALDPIYAARLGVETSELFISQPNDGEQALEMLEGMVRSGNFAVVVVDSVAALVPKKEIEGEMGDAQMGSHARLMSQAMRKLTGVVSTSNTCVIFINQIRTKIGVVFGNPEYTPGGMALKFYSSVRVDIRRTAQIKKPDGEAIGGRIKVKVVKNKVAPPFRTAEFDLMYNEGISREGEILAIGEKLEIVKKTGNTYNYNDTKLGIGYGNARAFLKKNKDVSDTLVDLISKELLTLVPVAPEGAHEAEVEPAE